MRFFDLLPRRVQSSLRERARYLTVTEKVRKLCRELGISPEGRDLSMLETVASIKSIANNVPETLLDIGAHRGLFAKTARDVLGFKRIVCVEPDVDLVPEIRRNLGEFPVIVENVALSGSVGMARFFVHPARSMSSLVTADMSVLRTKFPGYAHEDIEERQVSTKTLDKLVAELGLDNTAFFIKLDTQGNELNILRFGPRTLACTVACLIEFMFCTPYATDYTFRDLVDFMGDNGFSCAGALDIKRRPSHEVSGVDFLFLRGG